MVAAAGSCDVAGGRHRTAVVGGRHRTAVFLETTRPSGKSREESRIPTRA